jgi:tetratricopeptide (TPR) repeat protein
LSTIALALAAAIALGLCGAVLWTSRKTPTAAPPDSLGAPPPDAAPAGNPTEWIAEGLALADRLVEDFAHRAEALDLAARFHQRFGDSARAASLWRQCLDRDPRCAHAAFCLGSAAWEQGDFEQAVAYLRRALAIDPRLANAPVILGESLMQLGRPEEAIGVLEKAEAATPQSMRWFLLGQAYLQRAQYEKARRAFESAIALDPGYTKAYYGLVAAWSRLGDTKKAEEYQAVFVRLNAQENAEAAKERDARRDPGADEIRRAAARFAFDAARLYAARGDREEAGRLLARAAGLDPAEPGYRQALDTLSSSAVPTETSSP